MARNIPIQTKESASHEAEERKWRAESDLRTLQDADKIRRDKMRMRECKTVAKQQMKALKKI